MENRHNEPPIVKFATGAVRSADAEGYRFDLVCPAGLRRLAARCFLGAQKYGVGNWTKGLPVDDTLNHIETHLALWKGGDRSEDHLAAIAWGVFAIMHFQSMCTCGSNQAEFERTLSDYLDYIGKLLTI